MIVTVFRHRLRPENSEAYFKLAGELGAEATEMPGFVGRKVFTAEDGERVTIVEFDSMDNHRAWAEHHGHRAAQQRGAASSMPNIRSKFAKPYGRTGSAKRIKASERELLPDNLFRNVPQPIGRGYVIGFGDNADRRDGGRGDVNA